MKTTGCLFLFVLYYLYESMAFQCSELRQKTRRLVLSPVTVAAGRGMGMGVSASKSKRKKKATPSSPFDANASLLRLERKYDKLSLEGTKSQQDEFDLSDKIFTEFIVVARSNKVVTDWIPIAQLCLTGTGDQIVSSEDTTKKALQAAVSSYCRELAEVATIGSRLFKSLPRNEFQYAAESVDSFQRHVYEVVVEGKNENEANANVMTKAEARNVLKIESKNAERSEIKKRYRDMSMECHPDRFAGSDNEEEKSQNASAYARVKLAYETLISGIREDGKSWYESLGGRARTDFHGPLDLLSIASAEDFLSSSKIDSALTGLDPEIVQGFVTRSKS